VKLFVPYTKGGNLKLNVDVKGKNLADKSMRDLSVGIEFAQIVTRCSSTELLGPGGCS
jgi:hypothetical protein